MQNQTLSVAERVALLKQIFSDFGMPVLDNSVLEQTILAEFGRGKRSQLNQILLELHKETDAAVLSMCIGRALEQNVQDPEVLAVAKIMRERLPSLLQILDVRQQTNKRIELLEQLLQHFELKLQIKQVQPAQLENHEQIERLLRMLANCREQLKGTVQVQAISNVIENVGVVINQTDLRSWGKILHSVLPALISLEQPNIMLEQKVNYCVRALRVLGQELHNTKLSKAGDLLDDIHWLAKITLPKIPDHATIEQALRNLGISLGTVTLKNLRQKSKNLGITEHELTRVLHAQQEVTLLKDTQKNQQYAAICGLVAKIGQDIDCKELEMLGVAGTCLVAMRQTYCEMQNNQLNVVNFSESLGLIVSHIGVLTKNTLTAKVGLAIVQGVQAYSGIMAIPGGQAVAVPLAMCAVLGKLLLAKNSRMQALSSPASQELVIKIIEQVIKLQQDMREQFSNLYTVLEKQQQEVIIILNQGFTNLEKFLNYYSYNTSKNLYLLENKIESVKINLNQDFTDLYLEYVRDPIDEIDFYNKYKQGGLHKLQANKQKLSMWLLYKSRHRKVNGLDLLRNVEQTNELSNYVALVLAKTAECDAVLGMLSRYINLEFSEQLSEELPHVPAWILAANSYVNVLNEYGDCLDDRGQEPQIIADIYAVGMQIEDFITGLVGNSQLWRKISEAIRLHNSIVLDNIPLEKLTAISIVQAQATMADQQLELFNSCCLDITDIWQKELIMYVPLEVNLAVSQGLGQVYVEFNIDPEANNFAHADVDYNGLLPDNARDVLYKLSVYFKPNYNLSNSQSAQLLVTAWFAYDLGSARQRFDEYYRVKFMYPLKHINYNWISLDGRQNHVNGHGLTNTHKLIDHAKLAKIYQTWWLQAQPVNDPAITSRLRQNTWFNAKYKSMLDSGQYVVVNDLDILALRQLILTSRSKLVAELQQSDIIIQALGKLEGYYALLAAFRRLLNLPNETPTVTARFKLLLDTMLRLEGLQIDFAQQFNLLFADSSDSVQQPPNIDDYKHSLFGHKIQHSLAGLQLLSHSYTAARLR